MPCHLFKLRDKGSNAEMAIDLTRVVREIRESGQRLGANRTGGNRASAGQRRSDGDEVSRVAAFCLHGLVERSETDRELVLCSKLDVKIVRERAMVVPDIEEGIYIRQDLRQFRTGSPTVGPRPIEVMVSSSKYRILSRGLS